MKTTRRMKLKKGTWRIVLLWLLLGMMIAGQGRVIARCNDNEPCEVAPIPVNVKPRTGPRTIVRSVTPTGQPRMTIPLVALKSAGPPVRLDLAYVPGYPTPWVDADGAPLLGRGWRFSFPCLIPLQDRPVADAVMLSHNGYEQALFEFDPADRVLTSRAAPQCRLARADRRWVLSDSFGGRVVFAGFTDDWPQAVKGKPLAYENPYFSGQRGVRFHWAADGLLEGITDSAGRSWRFLYEAGQLQGMSVLRDDGLLLYDVRFHFLPETGFPDRLAAVEASLPGGDGVMARRVFRYYLAGFKSGLLSAMMGPRGVAAHGGIDECLNLPDDTFIASAAGAWDYAACDEVPPAGLPAPEVVVSRARAMPCATCSAGQALFHLFFYRFNDNAEASGINDWAVQIQESSPWGDVQFVDCNRYGRVLNMAKTAYSANGVYHQAVRVLYEDRGLVSRIDYPAEGYEYHQEKHGCQWARKGSAGQSMAQQFSYDDKRRMTETRIGRTSLTESEPRAWLPMVLYEYTGGQPWPDRIIQFPEAVLSDMEGDPDNGDGPVVLGDSVVVAMTYAFDGPPADLRLVARHTHLPAVPVEENGSGETDIQSWFYHAQSGALVKTVDAGGVETRYQRDMLTGLKVMQTIDPDGLALTTSWRYDSWDRNIEIRRPGQPDEIALTVPLDDAHYVAMTYPSVDGRRTGPVSLSVRNMMGDELGRARGVPDLGLMPEEALLPHAAGLREAWRGILSDQENFVYDMAGRLLREERVISPNEGMSQVYAKSYFYDDAGRPRKIILPDGTVRVFGYDALGRRERLWEGWEIDESDLTLREKRYYDVRDQLTALRLYTEEPRHEDREGALTAFLYDWRSRLVEKRLPEGPKDREQAVQYKYNNGDRKLSEARRTAGGETWHLMASYAYDDRGRLWRKFDHDRTAPERRGVEYYWHDPNGRQVKVLTPGGTYRKHVFDGAGRLLAVHLGYDPADAVKIGVDGIAPVGESYGDVTTPRGLSDDVIISSETYQVDGAGRPTLVTHFSRLPGQDALGELAVDGEGGEAPGAAHQAAFWYAPNGEVAHSVVYSRTMSHITARPLSVPFHQKSVLRTDYRYDGFDRLAEVRHPDGRLDRYFYDALGRQTGEIRNVVPQGEAVDQNMAVDRAYDGGDRLVEERVTTQGVVGRETKITQYIYGVRKDGSYASSLASGRYLREIRHPDRLTGEADPVHSRREIFAYDARGQVILRRSVGAGQGEALTHGFRYDALGRLVEDSVITLPAAMDQTVMSVGYQYNLWNEGIAVTAYELPGLQGDVRNQVAYTFNGFGQLTSEAQSHEGVCDAATPGVGYRWSEMGRAETPQGGGGGLRDGLSRLEAIQYPALQGAAPEIRFLYRGSDGNGAPAEQADWLLGRVSALTASFVDHRQVASYQYTDLGDAVLRESFPVLSGLTLVQRKTRDGFGRTAKLETGLHWQNNSVLPLQSFEYGYDEGGRMVKKTARGMLGRRGPDWLCRYDGLGRLTDAVQGVWRQGLFTDVSDKRRWTLTGTGNWAAFSADGETEHRLHNASDQVVSSTKWGDALYDGQGNLVRHGDTSVVYDAWHNVTALGEGMEAVVFRRDGLGRPIEETFKNAAGRSVTRAYYYKTDAQVVTVIENTGAEDGVVREDYVWGMNHEDEIILRRRISGEVQETLFYCQDALRNVTMVCNEMGLPVERYRYTPYGQVTILDGLGLVTRPESAVGNRVLFHGRWRMPGHYTRFYDFRNRMYACDLGRFLQKDKLRLPYKQNLYAAPFGDSFLDPSGLKPLLRNCFSMHTPILEVAQGIGLVFSAKINMSTEVCDCCHKAKNQWIHRGWQKLDLHGEVSLGFGAAMRIAIFGFQLGFDVQLVKFKPFECDVSRIINRCAGDKKACFSCGSSIAFGIPVITKSGFLGSISGGAQFKVSGHIQACVTDNGLEGNWVLCKGFEVFLEIQIFFLKKRFTFNHKKRCIVIPI